MKGMRVARQHGTTLRLVRQYSSLPEPPTKPRNSQEKFNNFKAPPASPHYIPVIARHHQQQPARPLFQPTKETLATTLQELNENCEIFKVHRLLTDRILEPEQAQSLFELAKAKNVATSTTYSLLISFYAKRGDLESAKKVLAEAEEAKMDIVSNTAIILVAYGLEKNDMALAERMFRKVNRNREQGFHAYRHMIRHLYFASRLNDFDAMVMEMINNHIRIHQDPEARNFVIWLLRTLHNLGRTAVIAQLYREVRNTPIVLPNDAYSIVIRSLGNEESSQIKKLVSDMKARNIVFDSRIYYPLLRALNRHETEFAKQIGDEMMKSDQPMDMRTYNAYLHVCVRHRTPTATHDALNCFEHIKQIGLKPDVLTYTNLIKACGQVGDVATCESLLQEMTKSGIQFTQDAVANILPVVSTEVSFKILKMLENAGVKADVVAYNMLLKRADAINAQQVLAIMEEEGVQKDAVTYNTLMGVYGRSRSIQKCKELLQEMKEKGIVADVWAYNAMIPALEIEQPADALEWLRDVRERGCQPDEVTYNSLFTNLLRKTKKSFVPLWEDMITHEIKPSVYTYNLYVKARGQAGEVDACEPLLREMRAKDLQPDVVTYSTCFDFITDIATLRRLREEMLAQGVEPGLPSYISLLRQCARSSESAWAEELLDDAQKRGLASKDAVKELKKLVHLEGLQQVPERLLEMYNNGNIK